MVDWEEAAWIERIAEEIEGENENSGVEGPQEVAPGYLELSWSRLRLWIQFLWIQFATASPEQLTSIAFGRLGVDEAE